MKNGFRTIDLFRELDADGDGYINKKDWRAGMRVIGPDVPVALLDAAFDEVRREHVGKMRRRKREECSAEGSPRECRPGDPISQRRRDDDNELPAPGPDTSPTAGSPPSPRVSSSRVARIGTCASGPVLALVHVALTSTRVCAAPAPRAQADPDSSDTIEFNEVRVPALP